ncbi:hypothetical protein Tco_1444934 [Tanacetum coccineum]
MRLFSQSGEDSFDDISMTLVLASFLGGFLVDEEALEAIFESGFRADYVRLTTQNGQVPTAEPAWAVPSA